MTNNTLIPLCNLYENTSKSGNRYLVGYLGHAKVIGLQNKGSTEPQWTLYLTEKAKPTARYTPDAKQHASDKETYWGCG